MRLTAALLLAALAGSSATAQPAATATNAYGRAPWWMDKPVIASTGYVWTEVTANRAFAAATYQAVEREVADATRAANDKVKALNQALAAYGADKVRVETSFAITPLYAQYRDREGQVNDNTRADKIERYQVNATVQVEIRDVRLAERVYATLLAAKPASTERVYFRLEPENETRTQMFKLAVEDARRRAQLATEAAGARLGAVRLIDPTARACNTDVLITGADQGQDDTAAYQVPPPAPPPPPPSFQARLPAAERAAQAAGLSPENYIVSLNPPLQRLEQKACVIFSLN
ncbi:SIMPL domain-containing protein [Phenylobacterium deserti]|uniref:SIMPL domain-containing protein n=1 Tax=Phenylobacterium deserti TaxID=1914756 RepID=A0A328AHX2_9CAUL|nr:SIMPL domain-containing protein [Phenylobacterium deserti]RAK52974.1 SIMPL domain-containing protein [Phenylobacterium deserti]